MNLIGNAIKFTEAGEVVVSVNAHLADEQPELVSSLNLPEGLKGTGNFLLHLTVKDTGIGIPTDKVDELFNAFEQADNSTTRRYGGTGLGLTICKSLVTMMNGRIWAEKNKGPGSTFHVVFPACSVDSSTSGILRTRRKIKGTRILVVDDNATNRRILETVLTNWGIDATVASSAAEAMRASQDALSRGQQFDMVLTDVHMPDMDGFELARRIRKDTAGTTLLMMLTSGDRPGAASEARELGVSAYLLKPVKQSELYDALMKALGVDSADDEDEYPPAKLPKLPPLQILLAEDSPANQKLAVGILSREGHTVTVASNGEEAVQRYSEQAFDIILMDIQMPLMDGMEAARTIRRNEASSGQHIPIVAMTAHAMPGDRDACLSAGMDDYVPKPIRVQQLHQALSRFFSAAAPGSEFVFEEQPQSQSVEVPIKGSETDTSIETPTVCVSSAETETGDFTNHSTSKPDEFARTLDWNAALDVVGGDQSLLADVVAGLVEEIPALLEQATACRIDGDAPGLRRATHTLKGGLRMFGDNRPVQIAEALELAAIDGRLATEGQIQELQHAFDSVLIELQDFLDSEPSANLSP